MDTLGTFVGIDLGGGRGKTTAVARLTRCDGAVSVEEVCVRHHPGDGTEEPWHDDALLAYLGRLRSSGHRVAVAINAPLTMPACVRCTEPVCPGQEVCEVPAVEWLRSAGAELVAEAIASDRDRIAAAPTTTGFGGSSTVRRARTTSRLAPYAHRATEVVLHFDRGIIPRGTLGKGNGPIAARAAHLRRLLGGLGFTHHDDLIEVSPRATVHALFGARKARGYKRDADPWETRASILEELGDLRFAPTSRLSREEVLRNDHCFEALLSAYTAYLWARDEWTRPDGVFADDGWIYAPPE